MRLILDTSFLIELKKGNKHVKETLRRESKNASDVGISILTLYELSVGAQYLRLKKGDYREGIWLSNLLDWLTVYKLSEEGVRLAAKLRAKEMISGESIPDMDLLIATTVPEAKLLSCDEDHAKLSSSLEKEGIEVVYVGLNENE